MDSTILDACVAEDEFHQRSTHSFASVVCLSLPGLGLRCPEQRDEEEENTIHGNSLSRSSMRPRKSPRGLHAKAQHKRGKGQPIGSLLPTCKQWAALKRKRSNWVLETNCSPHTFHAAVCGLVALWVVGFVLAVLGVELMVEASDRSSFGLVKEGRKTAAVRGFSTARTPSAFSFPSCARTRTSCLRSSPVL